MANAQRFSESFWGDDGYDKIMDKMKDSETSLKDFVAYMQDRSKIETEYAKALQKLAKSSYGVKEIGTIKNAWTGIKNEADSVASARFMFVNDVRTKIIDPMTTFKDSFKDALAGHGKEADKAIKNWKDSKTRVEKMKEAYDKACKTLEQSEQQTNRDSANPDISEKKKAEQQDKLQKNIKQKDASYKDYTAAVDHCKNVRERYIDHLTQTYEKLQGMEEERIDVMSDVMNSYVKACVATVVASEDHYRKLLAAVDQIDRVAATKQTGSKWPIAPVFIEYGEAAPKVEEEQADPAARVDIYAMSYRRDSMTMAPDAAVSTASPSTASTAPRYIGTCRALYDYESSDSTELAFVKVIRITQKDPSGWWCGAMDGRVGIFPSNFVKEISDEE